MSRTLVVVTIILLSAMAMRLYRLDEIPPGLTHDEANHGREAIEILDGVLRYYFPLNYGSEPLYSYTVAGSMLLLGENVLALRLVNVVFGLAAIVITALWARQVLDRPTALVCAGLLAVSFWPVASSREALRAGMLPFFMALAVWFFWQLVCNPCGEAHASSEAASPPAANRWRQAGLVAGFALSLVATFHIYLAARVSWLLFPLFLIYLALVYKEDFRRAWRPAVGGMLVAGLLLVPMFIYLTNNPFAQTRLSMLDGTLTQVSSGEFGPIVGNVTESLLAFIWPGFGDQFLAYNIPGRPVFDLLSAIFFVAGLSVAAWRWRQPAYAFLLLWFVTGIVPSLVTGATANTTRNLAALPAVYLLAAVGFLFVVRSVAGRFHWPERAALTTGAAIWLAIVALVTVQDYFVRWGQSADVRGAYQHTLVEGLAYLESQQMAGRPVVFSSVYPGPAHDPSIALVLVGDASAHYRWVDARSALLLPQDSDTLAIIPSSTPPHPAFATHLEQLDTVLLRPDDLDPQFSLYSVNNDIEGRPEPLASFGSAVELVDAQWLTTPVNAGDMAELLTTWVVTDPQNIGPLHPPAFQPATVFFTHLLDETGTLVSQHDTLDAPSWSWQKGDTILQIHRLRIPDDAAGERLTPYLGIYDRQTGERVPLFNAAGPTLDTLVPAPALEVAHS